MRAGRTSALLFVACACSAIPGCARALREPPPLRDLGVGEGGSAPSRDSSPAGPAEVDSLLKRAAGLYAARDLLEVKEAARVFLEAARADATSVEGLVGAVRAHVWLVDHETDQLARRDAATSAVQSAQWCGRIEPDNPACAYWLGAALGVQARERRSTGLDALPLIEQAFKKAADTAPSLEEGGPDRALALLYLRAPGWPTGPGDPDLGLTHARKAVQLSPAYPPNQLALAEALKATGDIEESARTYQRALDLSRSRATARDPDASEWIEEAEQALKGASR